MNPITRAIHGTESALKAAASSTGRFVMQWAGRISQWGSVLLPRSRFDYHREVGNGSGSSAVMACINWITRTWPESPLTVWFLGENGERDADRMNPMVRLIRRPNPSYSGSLLWAATLRDYYLSGNAFWLKVRGANGAPIELWWAPSYTMAPVWPDDGSEFISYYEYTPSQTSDSYQIATADVVHFRFGLDPDNPRMGLSPLASVYREIFTDDEAANYTAALLRNMGVPGMVIAPDSDAPMSRVQAEEAKLAIEARFTGDNRGRPLLMSGKTKVTLLSFSPEQMQLRTTRSIPEERISAVIGIPAIVAGLGAGLDRSTFSNTEQAREAAYESNIIPTQELFADEIDTQLYEPDFANGREYEVGFDRSNVRVLQEDQDALAKRVAAAVDAGVMMVSEGRSLLGLDTGPEHEYFLLPGTLTPTRLEDLFVEPQPVNDQQPPQLPPGQDPNLTPEEQQAVTTLRGLRRLRLRKAATVVEITDADLERAETDWDSLVPEQYQGLLAATVDEPE